MGRNNRALFSGLFIAILVAATTTVIYWLGHLDRQRDIYTISTQAAVTGLNPESTVFYRGIAVGKVLNIQFDPKNSDIILIKIEVDKNIVLTKGVYATLHLKGVTGLTQLELSDSGKINEKLSPGDDNIENRIPLTPSTTDRLLDSGDELLKKADHLMLRLNSLLNEENEKNIVGILVNLKTLSDKLNNLQQRVDTALAEVPSLTKDAKRTLKNIDTLAADLKSLSREAKSFSKKFSAVADTGNQAGAEFVTTTLPKVNKLLNELQATTDQVKKIAVTLENNPQAILSVVEQSEPGPGEPGFEEPK